MTITPFEALVRTGHRHPNDVLNAFADYGFMVVDASTVEVAEEHVEGMGMMLTMPPGSVSVDCTDAHNEMMRRRARRR